MRLNNAMYGNGECFWIAPRLLLAILSGLQSMLQCLLMNLPNNPPTVVDGMGDSTPLVECAFGASFSSR